MHYTEHALARKCQRNITDDVIDIILSNGRISYAPGGALKVFFGKKETNSAISELKKAIRLIERAKNGTVILANDTALTLYKKH